METLNRNSRIGRPTLIGLPIYTPFLVLRRKPFGSVSVTQTPEPALLLELLFAAPSAVRLRRRRNDVRNARIIHLFVQRG
jgi:hypothetical protein